MHKSNNYFNSNLSNDSPQQAMTDIGQAPSAVVVSRCEWHLLLISSIYSIAVSVPLVFYHLFVGVFVLILTPIVDYYHRNDAECDKHHCNNYRCYIHNNLIILMIDMFFIVHPYTCTIFSCHQPSITKKLKTGSLFPPAADLV